METIAAQYLLKIVEFVGLERELALDGTRIWPRHRALGREDSIFIGGNGECHFPREQHPRSLVHLHEAPDPALPSQHARRDAIKYLRQSPRTI
jgi:hypothetical protein